LRRRTIDDISPKLLEDKSLFFRFCKEETFDTENDRMFRTEEIPDDRRVLQVNARDFNLKEAENMLRKHIIWRKEMQLDSILTDYKPPE
ncbi:hypothetical protein NPIL_508992, partial [Nephila pilipes]